jgi:uncharacterized membrane-anchored protein
VEPKIIAGIAAPVVLLLVWALGRNVRKRMTRELPGAPK